VRSACLGWVELMTGVVILRAISEAVVMSERKREGWKIKRRKRERATNRAKERGCAPLNLGRSGVPCACQNLNVIACISVLVINSNCAPLTKRAEKTQPVGPFFGVGAARPN
jgi:hypothetical protein